MRAKSSQETAKTFRRMIGKKKHQKVWSYRGTELFEVAFQQLCENEEIDTYTTESGTKSAFAERNRQLLQVLGTRVDLSLCQEAAIIGQDNQLTCQ